MGFLPSPYCSCQLELFDSNVLALHITNYFALNSDVYKKKLPISFDSFMGPNSKFVRIKCNKSEQYKKILP